MAGLTKDVLGVGNADPNTMMPVSEAVAMVNTILDAANMDELRIDLSEAATTAEALTLFDMLKKIFERRRALDDPYKSKTAEALDGAPPAQLSLLASRYPNSTFRLALDEYKAYRGHVSMRQTDPGEAAAKARAAEILRGMGR